MRRVTTPCCHFAKCQGSSSVPTVRTRRLRVSGALKTGIFRGVSDIWVYEKSMIDATGASMSRFVGGTIDCILFLICCAGSEAFWSWPEVMEIAGRQANRVHEVFRTTGDLRSRCHDGLVGRVGIIGRRRRR